MMQLKVSVIVPIYNAKPYLAHCLETLTHQTLKDLELILVLDCPTDGSDVIAEEYARKYTNIRLIHNEKNLHVSESRNRGMKMARGKYIAFSDADDFQELSMYEDMYRTAEQEDADVVLIDRKSCTSDKYEPVIHTNRPHLQGGEKFLKENLLKLVRGDFKLYTSWLYTHLYRREFLEDIGVFLYDSRSMMAEDLLFNIQVYHRLLQKSGKLVYLPQAYYYYVVYEGNLCHSMSFYTLKMTFPLLIQICREMNGSKFFSDKELSEALGARIISKLYSAFCKEVRMYGIFASCRHLMEYRHIEEIRNALKEYKVCYDSCLPLKKNIFGYLLRALIN